MLATLFQPIGAKLSSKKKIFRTLCLTLLRSLTSLPCLLLTQDQLPILLNRFSHPWELSRILLKVLNQLRLILLKLRCFLPSFHPTLKLFEWKNVAIMKELTNPGSQILMDRYMKTSEYLGTTLKESAQARSSASTVIRSPITKDGSCIQELKDTDRLLSLVFALRILTDDSRRVQVQKWIKFQAPFFCLTQWETNK